MLLSPARSCVCLSVIAIPPYCNCWICIQESYLAGRGSLDTHTRALDNLRPALHVGGEQASELLGRAVSHVYAFRRKALADLWLLEDGGDLGVEALHDIRRQP